VAAPCYNSPSFSASICTEDCIDKRFIRTNERIRAREIRVIDDQGTQLGIMPPFEALKIAREKNMDVVEVSPTAQPPVCRIMDFGKYVYQQEKREREAKKHQHQITVKEVKFRINVDEHDYETKKNHVLRFLADGDKVKATIFFRGREMTRTMLGRKVLDRLISELGDKAVVEFRPRQEGNTLHAILAPPKVAAPPKKASSGGGHGGGQTGQGGPSAGGGKPAPAAQTGSGGQAAQPASSQAPSTDQQPARGPVAQ
jgi:translation initiation factor IF-3